MSRIGRVKSKPPMPTKDDPYLQLKWLCAKYTRRYENRATRAGIENSMQAFIKTLSTSSDGLNRNAKEREFLLSMHCDPFMIYRAIMVWQGKKHSPWTIGQRCRQILQVLNYGIDEKLIPDMTFCGVEIGDLHRTTLTREAFEDQDLNRVFRVLQPMFEYATRVANGYDIQGVGQDPTQQGRRKRTEDNSSKPSTSNGGWGHWENLVWYFENRLMCQPTKNWVKHKRFLQACSEYGGYSEVYRRLGVTLRIDLFLIAPLAVKLCWQTGLNPETLLSLKADCFQEHHALTGLPYLKYYKNRSTGEKDLHLSLLDSADETLISMEYKQSVMIRRTIQLIAKLTAPLRERADTEDTSYLFLYESLHRRRGVVRLNVGEFWYWARAIRLKLKRDKKDDLPDVFTLGRFRPTKITHLVRDGKHFLDVQTIVGHLRGSTTLRYLASHQIAPKAQKEVAAALQRIHENKREFEKKPKPYATEGALGKRDVIYKALLCDCKDVFNPPENIRKVIGDESRPCTYFNMCLTCPNALILKRHLPALISYKREIESAIAEGLSGAPNSTHYEKSLAVIEGILLEFTDADLEWAKQVEQESDIHMDPFTYRPVR